MIYEYAIEPAVVVEWAKKRKSCRIIIDNFGLGKPRLMADFPKLKNWRKQFRHAAGSINDMAKCRLEELFMHLTEKRVQRNSYDYDGNNSWLENTEKENKRRPFRAILVVENPTRNDHVLQNNLLGDWPDEKWSASRGITVPRKAEEMAAAISSMLQNSEEVKFIDPYFRPSPKWLEPLTAFLKNCVESIPSPGGKKIEIHTTCDPEKRPSFACFKEECRKMPKDLPKGITITFKVWKQREGGEKLHNRYVLTDIGGVSFGTGLDQGKEGETDDITLLNRDQYVRRWQQYASDTPAFDLAAKPFQVTGKA